MMKTPYPACNRVGKVGRRNAPARFFDIVNGFLIDAVAHWFVRLRPSRLRAPIIDDIHLAEIIVRTYYNAGFMQT